jgi:hypothetical protein
MRTALILLLMLLLPVLPAPAAVSIGINVQVYPDFEPVPNYPVYYAPRLDANYFFYDGSYWVYSDDNWYVSSWYNGPWEMMDPYDVPVFILRIPVRYYRHAPSYFRGWQPSAPPRWGDHWGHDWSQRRGGWDRWNHKSVPARPPLPVYQRNYSGDRYPRDVEQQKALHRQNYHYQPRESGPRESGPRESGARQQDRQLNSGKAQRPAEPSRPTRQESSKQKQQPPSNARDQNGRPGQGAPQEKQQERGRDQQKDGKKAGDNKKASDNKKSGDKKKSGEGDHNNGPDQTH